MPWQIGANGRPKGGPRPKLIYPSVLVADVGALYADGLTQIEIARQLDLSQKVVWRVMRNHGIRARSAAKRDQKGARNHAWRGEQAGYQALHLRVVSVRGTPARCEECDLADPKRRYEWANISGRYTDPSDYRRLCIPCHRRFDNQRRRAGVKFMQRSGRP